MNMRYQRPIKNREVKIPFSPGVHEAIITGVIMKKSKKDTDMFVIILENAGGDESGVFCLTFGTDFTDTTLTFLIASIEDNGVEIPSIDFGYNKETANFLKNKKVYIKVEESLFDGELRSSVKTFLSQEELDTILDAEEENE